MGRLETAPHHTKNTKQEGEGQRYSSPFFCLYSGKIAVKNDPPHPYRRCRGRQLQPLHRTLHGHLRYRAPVRRSDAFAPGSDRRVLSRVCVPLGGRRASRLRLCPSLERESSLSLYPRNDDLPRTPVRRTRRRPSLIVAPGRRLPQGRLPLAHRLYHPKQCGQRNASPQGGFPPCLPVCPGGDKFGRWIDVADYQLLLVE